jgi:Rod binding domain-containing protein
MKPIDGFSMAGALWKDPVPLADPVNSQETTSRKPQPKKAELEQICAEFAAIFFQTLLKSMYSTIHKSSLCPEFKEKNLVNSVVDQGVAQFMASHDTAALKESLLRKLMSDKK